MLQLIVIVLAVILIGWLAALMLAQKPVTSAQQLIQQHRYEDAVAAAANDPLHRAEALKLLGRYEDAIASYRRSDDPAAQEGIALSLAHLNRDLDEAKRLMEETIALHPQIQEFQALGLAYILLKRGNRDDALRIYADNLELLETRFRDDYTDPDPLLAETLVMFAALSDAAGDSARASPLSAKAAQWAPRSIWGAAVSPAAPTLSPSTTTKERIHCLSQHHFDDQVIRIRAIR
jgi:tetratricopeptide (TPR) repeat protein